MLGCFSLVFVLIILKLTSTWSTAAGKLHNVSSFWQITDIHWDPMYSQLGSINNQCHEIKSYVIDENETSNSEEKLGFFGSYGCDSPWTLIRSAVKAMRKIQNDPSFILWTGDNSPSSSNPNMTAVLSNMKQVLQLLLELFPKSIIVPSLGNFDLIRQSAQSFQDKEFYSQVLKSAGWQKLIPRTTRIVFLKGGYYTFIIETNLRIISLNTNLFSNATFPSDEALNQLHWLDSVLRLSQGLREKVLIIGHHPPGFQENNINETIYHKDFNDYYVHLVQRHSEIIKGQFFGHLHSDTFRLIKNKQGEISGTIFVSSSLAPTKAISSGSYPNPAIRLYTYEPSNWDIIDYQHYILNLTTVNKITIPFHYNIRNMKSYYLLGMDKQLDADWTLEYSAVEAYGISNLTSDSLKQLYNLFSEPCSTWFEKYLYYYHVGSIQNCDDDCKHHYLCTIISLKAEEFQSCINKSVTNCLFSTSGIPSFQHLRLMDHESNSTTSTNSSPLVSSFNPYVFISTMIILIVITTVTVICIRRKRWCGYGPRYFRAFGFS